MMFSAQGQDNNKLPKSDSIKVQNLNAVEITGQKILLTGKTEISPELSASPASVTLLGSDYVAKQPVLSYGDLLRPLAGVNVTNYQNGGVGYGIEMRGYTTLEHARDINFSIDGVPQNQGSSIQANGYVDLNMLIPESIRKIEVVRGPNSAFYGDHDLGGSVAFETENKLPTSVQVTGGTYGYLRGLGVLGFGKNDASGYIMLEGKRSDGYRDNTQQKGLNGLAKYAFPLFNGLASLRAQAFAADYNAPGYISRADIDNGKLSRNYAINNTDHSTSRQQNIVFNYKGADTTAYFAATLFAQHHDFIRIRTGGIGRPQKEERDNRTWYGGDFHYTTITALGDIPFLYTVGVGLRSDDIANTGFKTFEGNIVSQNSDKQIQTNTPSVYLQTQLKLTNRLKLTLGARYDYLLYSLQTGSSDSDTANFKISPNMSVFSPKVGAAYEIIHGVSIFVNASQGFKAPSANDDLPSNPNLTVSKVTSYEIGISGDNDNGRLHGLISAYYTEQTREVATDPLGNLTNFGNTRRNGVEAEGRVAFENTGGLALFGNISIVDAKILNGDAGSIYVTNTPQYTSLLGLDYNFGTTASSENYILASVYDQLVGTKNLKTDGSVTGPAFQRLGAKLTYKRRNFSNFSFFLEGTYYPGTASLDEVSFLSRGIIVTSPQAQATFDAGLKFSF